jgi:hypothetical protein
MTYKVVCGDSKEAEKEINELAKQGFKPTLLACHPRGYLYVLLEKKEK